MNFKFFDKRTLSAGILIACSTFLTPIAQGAPGYIYEAIYTDGQFANQNLIVKHGAINNRGQVVFTTAQTIGDNSQILRTYVAAPGQAPQLVFESPTWTGQDPDPHIYPAENGIGINDDGIVAVGLIRSIFDENDVRVGDDIGYGLFAPGTGLIREIPVLRQSTGHLNNSLQMGGIAGTALVITDGITSASASAVQGNLQEVNVNESGAVATSGFLSGSPEQIAVFWATPPSASQAAALGDRFGIGHVSFLQSTGLNDLGWMSTVTDTLPSVTNPNPRVLLVSPTGALFVVAQTAGSNFVNFRQPGQPIGAGVSLNNLNRVSFAAQSADGSDFIWIGDASGDEPRVAMDSDIEFTDGRSMLVSSYSNSITHHAVRSLNDVGEISVITFGTISDANGTVVQSGARALFVARPAAGSEPGNPILPDPGDALPGTEGGWRFNGRCWRTPAGSIAGCVPGGARTWYDPPIAVGYDYTMDADAVGAFTSVLIPAPLPGGDSEFTIEVDGGSAPLLAGAAFDLATIATGPVRTFRISGIDTAEAVDPADPVVFLTGLSFAAGTDEDVSFTMIPVVVDALDTDGDGLVDDFENANPPLDPLDPDSDDDGIGDALDTKLRNPANFCLELGPDNVTMQQVVTTDLTCAARQSINVVPLSEVSGSGNLHLIAPIISFESGFTVFGFLTVISANPCPNCTPP